ncbi:MAG: hypothetical protein KJ970_09290 [Candidatus Eisenbacteria bacterium]|uniref:Uncharacterized protein n=1 Tax=Eiseniibacteriota bacterium TaxID=2212470 RepID=A0A948RX11_UNCEI|nr:hypothetical protein [Candidatus Eisenbacteria bacterium]MBU1948075.1 hypothetical protein [Candidatus Eisenbacteria bacterium]MBU2691112.1 hypothetical protein [Candidatus Eisenbacteria bacterium]
MKQGLLLCAIMLYGTLPMGVQADMLWVPDNYSTISLACEEAVAGDTVAVLAGNYEESAHVKPGVSVIGMVPDSTAIRVESSDPYGPFILLPGTEPVLIKNMKIVGGPNSAFANNNPNTTIERCLITAGEFYSYLGLLWESITFSSCFIGFSAGFGNLFYLLNPVTVYMQDCVIMGDPFSNWWAIPAGSQFEIENNTIHARIGFEFDSPPTTEFTLRFTNNIIEEVFCSDTQPDVLEWRYNDIFGFGGLPDCGDRIGNFSADPLLCDPDGPEADNRLEPESPCLAAGENGEDVGARLGICWDPAGVEDELASVLPPRLWAYPNVIGRAGCTLELTRQSVTLPPAVGVFDVLGRRCATLRLSPRAGATFTARWPGTDDQGRKLPGGVYWLRPTGRTDVSTRVLIVK